MCRSKQVKIFFSSERDIIERENDNDIEYSEAIHVKTFFSFCQLIVSLKLPFNLKLRIFKFKFERNFRLL